jgi:uncharacterized protein (TIGR02444 family)
VLELRTFAIRVYSAPEVARACLALQDEAGVDVPLLLFCGWYAVQAGEIDDKTFAAAKTIAQELGEQLIYPLRNTRRWMKNRREDQPWIALREAIKASELQAELLLLEQLQSCLNRPESEKSGSDPEPTHSEAEIRKNLLRCVTDPAALSEKNQQQLQCVAHACTQF